jgi:PhnB protein
MSKQPIIDQLNDAIGRILADPDVQVESPDAALADLLQAARDLRDLPNPDFKRRLRAELERNISMSTRIVTFRPGFRTVTPYLLAPDASYLDFMKNVFGAVETERTQTSPTSFHSEWKIGDSMVTIGVGAGRSMPAALQVYVPDADETFKRALDAGAKELSPLMVEYGDRFGCVEDPAGNQLYISTHLGANYTPETVHTVTTYFHPAGAAKFIDFVKRAFGGHEVERHDSPVGAVLHAKIRIGDSVIAVGEPHGQWQPMPTMMYLYVPNVDGLYQQAVQAGAKSIQAPVNRSYGDRSAGVEDEWGNQWYMATPV